MVFVTTNRFSASRPFYANSATVRLPYLPTSRPTWSRPRSSCWSGSTGPAHYQKCGVMLLDLSPVIQVQANLFDARDRAREAWLMRALDSLNADYGARTVRVGHVGGTAPAWAMRQAFGARATRRIGGSCRS